MRVGRGRRSWGEGREARASYIIEGGAEIRAGECWVGSGWAGPLDPCGTVHAQGVF